MKGFYGMKQLFLSLLVLAAWSVGSCSPVVKEDQPSPAIPVATEAFKALSVVTIPAISLEGNLVGEPATRDIFIYLPPSYGDPNKRFPTVYYLPGYSDSGMIGFNLPDSMNNLIESGKVNEMIVVVASGTSRVEIGRASCRERV